MDKKVYCSLDIETTGFDPNKDEILEIGFVFFSLGKKGIKLGEEYSRVFKPKGPVPETILALTGISTKELEAADAFAGYVGQIQESLKGSILVGHNIGFDIKFLEGLGLKFSGQSVDTLDLAQFILPTHKSYNLENLMYYFGVPHTEAHRALADAKASVKVLQGLLGLFSNFPQELRSEIFRLLKPYNLPYGELLEVKYLSSNKKKVLAAEKLSQVNFHPALKNQTFYNFPLGVDILTTTAVSLKSQKSKSLFVVPHVWQAMDLWQAGRCEAIFAQAEMFNERAFQHLKSKENLSPNELKFVLKILVWFHTNRQNKYTSDLNLSFFGGQFKHLISGSEIKEHNARFLACDISSFLEFRAKGWYQGRQAVFLGLAEMERALSDNLGEKLSWGNISYLLKSMYNPETGTGEVKHKQEVEAGLLASDLFFGLASALLQTDTPGFLQIKLETVREEHLGKIRQAAENFQSKLVNINKTFKSPEIASFTAKLIDYFQPEENLIKWIELSPKSCVFYSSPINIRNLAKEVLEFNSETIFVDSLPRKKAWEYFQKRLGLDSFQSQEVRPDQETQADLFSVLRPKREKINLETKPAVLSDPELLEHTGVKSLPAALIFGSTLPIKTFYHAHYELLKKTAFVLAQSGAGGDSRILRNFMIHQHSLLLASSKFVLKSLTNKGAGTYLGSLPVKTLILGNLPFEQYTHPYLEAVSKQFGNAFEDFSLPRALINFHNILKFFYTPALKKVVVADSKLTKPYAKVFLDYLAENFSQVN